MPQEYESRDVKMIQNPEMCSIVISAPGSEKSSTTIRADKEENKLQVFNSGKLSNEALIKHAEKFELETAFAVTISVDKRYDVSKAKAEFLIGYIFINIPLNTERMVDIT